MQSKPECVYGTLQVQNLTHYTVTRHCFKNISLAGPKLSNKNKLACHIRQKQSNLLHSKRNSGK